MKSFNYSGISAVNFTTPLIIKYGDDLSCFD